MWLKKINKILQNRTELRALGRDVTWPCLRIQISAFRDRIAALELDIESEKEVHTNSFSEAQKGERMDRLPWQPL